MGYLALQACFFDSAGVASPPDPYAYRGNFSITAPAATGAVHLDSGLHIAWEPRARMGEPLSIYLHSDSVTLLLASGVPDTGRYSVDLRALQVPRGDRFRVKLVSERDTALWDYSGPFWIVPEPAGRIRFGGLEAGTVAKIESTLTFSAKTPMGEGAPYQFSLLKDWVPVASIHPRLADAGTGRLDWYVTGNDIGSGDGFRIRAHADIDGRENLGYSPPFSIRSDYAGGYVVSGHSAADTLHPGTVDTVFWAKSGNPGAFSKLVGLYLEGVLVHPLGGGMNIDAALAYTAWTIPPALPLSSKYRLGVRSLSDASILSFSDDFTILGIEPDAFEPDGSADRARDILPGAPPQRRTLTFAEEDWVRFTAVPGKRYGLLSLGPAEGAATLFEADGKSVAIPFGQRFGVIAPTQAATLRLRIRYAGGKDAKRTSGAYSLYLHAWDSAQTLAPVGVSAAVPGDTLRGGAVGTVSWTPDTSLFGSAIRADLYRDSTWIRVLADSTPNTGRLDWIADAGFGSSASYRVRISRPDVPELSASSPPFPIAATAPDGYEPDDSEGEAGRILAGAGFQVRNLTVSDTDWVAFECLPGADYAVRAESEFPLLLTVTSKAGTAHVVGGTSPVVRLRGEGGGCLIQVFSGGSGAYRLSVTAEPAP